MGRSLRSLEQSLSAPAVTGKRPSTRRAKARVEPHKPKKSGGFSVSLSPDSLAPAQLQEQIDVIRGRRLAQPTRSLRALEDRLLGRDSASTRVQPRQTLRLDNGQVAPPTAGTATSPAASPPSAPPSAVTPALSYPSVPAHNAWPTAQAAHAASLWPQPRQPVTASAAPYAPELSAPGIGRFQVESFAGPLSPEDLFKPDAAVSAPSTPAPSAVAIAPSTSPGSGARLTAGPALDVPINDDAIGWLTQAQSEQPKKITGASRKSLDAGLALAKDEFERELASILGQPATAPAPVVAPPIDPLFQNALPPNGSTQAPPTSQAPPAPVKPPVPDPNAPPPHPNHDIFDQMGLAMRYANSFDLGNVKLNDRFNQIEQALEPAPAKRPPTVPASNPFVDPYANPMSLDDFDLVAELAEISTEKPVCAPTPQPIPQSPNSTDLIAGEHHE